jgi:ABC-type thiamin/hydroxymethylpyrimidine transport system permease subunit
VDLYLRVPLHLPGWRGLIVMGLLVAARQLSGRAWAASFAGFAAACTSLALAGPPRFTTLALLAPGLAIDAIFILFPRWPASVLVAGLAAGLGNVVKFAVSFLAFTAFAQRDGAVTSVLMPWFSHFGFGLCGGIIAVLLTRPRKPETKAQ